MKAHKHKDVIIAWANGAEIQVFCDVKNSWIDNLLPEFQPSYLYRVRPREFKEGAWYPILIGGDYEVSPFRKNAFISFTTGSRWHAEDVDWIGEELKIEWPDE